MPSLTMTPGSPATLVQVRAFLAAHGAPVAPWAGPDAALDALVGLLRERRHDDRFWEDLAALTRNVRDARVRPELVEGSEVLAGASIDRLIRTLRHHLGDDGAPARSWATSLPNVGAFAAFVLLATAWGCGKSETADTGPGTTPPTTPPPTTDTEPCAEALAEGLEGDDADVYCAIVEIVQGSTLDAGTQADLLECIADLAAAERETWLAEFQAAGSDQALADLLYERATTYPCYEDTGSH